MSKSHRIRDYELRAIFTLVGECRELGADAFQWRQHAFDGLDKLIGDHVGIGGEFAEIKRFPASLKIPFMIERGYESDSSRKRLYEFVVLYGPAGDAYLVEALKQFGGYSHTSYRRQLLDDHLYYGSECFNEYKRPAALDDPMISLVSLGSEAADVLTFHRRLGDAPWSDRDRVIVETFHRELQPMIGAELASPTDHEPVPLSLRQEQTLDLLLEGLSEQQIAKELDLSMNTVHQYVRRLYARYGVTSRAELLALWIRRHRRSIHPNG